MEKFEYFVMIAFQNGKVVSMNFQRSRLDTTVLEALEFLGKEGWELVQVTAFMDEEHRSQKIQYSFKRLLK